MSSLEKANRTLKAWVLVDAKREEKEFKEGFTIKNLLADLDLDEDLYWVARNRVMLKRNSYDRITIGEGDIIEILRVMSGG